ncbi:MAG: Flp pilus assembly protein CpaB [Pseudomonadota bacterium]|jgi:pilus assembly protein CpaB
MNNRALMISIVMSVVAVFFVRSYVVSKEEESAKKFGTQVLVIVAKTDIKEMETLTEKVLEYKEIPKRFLEPASISVDPKERESEQDRLKDLKKFAGSIAVVPIKKGEQVTLNKISEPSIRTGLSPQIAPGKRAVTIQINELSGVAKLVKPGDRVDVIAVIDLALGKENKFARTILQDVIILATGKNVTNNPARYIESDPLTGKEKIRPLSEDLSFNTVTVEVDVNQAQALAILQSGNEATLFLSLRHNDDSERIAAPVMSYRDLIPPEMARQAAGNNPNLRNPAGR